MHCDTGWHVSRDFRLKADEVKISTRIFPCSLLQSPDFSLTGGGVAQICADLYKILMAVRIPGQKIYLISSLGADVSEFGATSFQQNASLKGVPQIGPSRPVKDRNQCRVDRVDLARVHHSSSSRGCGNGHCTDQKCVLQITQICMKCILGHRDYLRPQIPMEFVHTERTSRISYQVPYHPSQRHWMRHGMSFDYIAQGSRIHIAAQQFEPVPVRDIHGLWKTTSDEIFPQVFLDSGASGLGQTFETAFGLPSKMPKIFAETERMHQRLHGPPAHARGHLARKESCRGTGKEKLHLLRIKKPASKVLPPVYNLDFVQEKNNLLLISPFRVQAVVFFQHKMQTGSGHVCQPFVLEAEVR